MIFTSCATSSVQIGREAFSSFSRRKGIPFTETLEVLHLENHFINLVGKAMETKGIEEGQYDSIEHGAFPVVKGDVIPGPSDKYTRGKASQVTSVSTDKPQMPLPNAYGFRTPSGLIFFSFTLGYGSYSTVLRLHRLR